MGFQQCSENHRVCCTSLSGFRLLFSHALEMVERIQAELHAFLSVVALLIPKHEGCFLRPLTLHLVFVCVCVCVCKPGEVSEEPVNGCAFPCVGGLHGFYIFLLAQTQPLGIH